MALCTLTVTSVSAQQMDQTAKNLKFYGHVWDVVVNEGRVDMLDTAFAENVILPFTIVAMVQPITSTSLLVAGIPKKVPVCLPLKFQYFTTLLP